MDNYAASFSLVIISCIMCVAIMYIYGRCPRGGVGAWGLVASWWLAAGGWQGRWPTTKGQEGPTKGGSGSHQG